LPDIPDLVQLFRSELARIMDTNKILVPA
jgi:hypothetical protein